MKFEELTASVPSLRDELATKGLVTVRGVETVDDGQLLAFAESFSDAEPPDPKVLAWDFGTIMRMKYDPDAANYLFSNERVPLHWDGAFHREARYLLFFCDSSTGDGGDTVFVDTTAILRDASPEEVSRWEGVTLTYTTEKKAHYGGTFSTRVVRSHPFYPDRKILRFAEVVETKLNPVQLDIDGTDDPGFYAELEGRVLDPKYRALHSWLPGDVVIVDNHAFLHGRTPLGKNTGRSFRRIQIL